MPAMFSKGGPIDESDEPPPSTFWHGFAGIAILGMLGSKDGILHPRPTLCGLCSSSD